jgi:hypothetical protein
VGYLFVTHRFCILPGCMKAPASMKNNEHTGQDHCPGNDQEG